MRNLFNKKKIYNQENTFVFFVQSSFKFHKKNFMKIKNEKTIFSFIVSLDVSIARGKFQTHRCIA